MIQEINEKIKKMKIEFWWDPEKNILTLKDFREIQDFSIGSSSRS